MSEMKYVFMCSGNLLILHLPDFHLPNTMDSSKVVKS